MADEDKRKGQPGPDDKDDDPFKFPSDDFKEESDEPAAPEEKQGDFGAFAEDGSGQEGQGLDDLPPLSDFESSEDDVTPARPGGDEDELGGLPPLSDLGVDEGPGAGAKRDTPAPEFEHPSDFQTPSHDSDFETPRPGGTGFQDLAGDSDFSPETPQFSPGPDSDMDTPTFDSAFGGEGGGPDTSAPTQAMETPMFGGGREEGGEGDFQGFDEGAFGQDSSETPFGGGTPAPDFSPDTGFTGAGAAAPPPSGPAMQAQGGDSGGGGMGRIVLVVVGLIVVGLIGIVAGPHVAQQVDFLDPINPYVEELETRDNEIQQLNMQISSLRNTIADLEDVAGLAEVPVEELQAELESLIEQHEHYSQQVAQVEEELFALQEERDLVAEDLEQQREEFVQVQQEFEDLLNETAIVEARQEGLVSEVDRLQGLVGQLEEANERRSATLAALRDSAEQLAARIEQGIDLTPRRYARADRIQRAEDLLERVEQAGWVEPDLLDDYTQLYLEELELAEMRKYFFARIPVQDRFGTTTYKWAECLMNGNWSVYFRTIDGRQSGIYMNVADTGAPQYQFVMDLPGGVRSHVEQSVMHNRTPGYEEQMEALADQDRDLRTETAWQRVFRSL